MLILRKQGLYCEAGDFYIDPVGAVDRALLTHAHSDHARRGAKLYVTPHSGVGLLRARLGSHIPVEGRSYGERFQLGSVLISFHPAGHILGSSQVRLELDGQVWVVSGDYKREPDPTCEPFEVVTCDVFVTEATFGTPSYRWEKGKDVGREIFEWWEKNRSRGVNSLLCAYSLGKTQRILGMLCAFTDRSVLIDPAATKLTDCYRREGVKLLPTSCLSALGLCSNLKGELVIAPPSFLSGPYVQALGNQFETAFASGWMSRGERGFGLGSSYDRGFVLSDHADWDDLLRTVRETGARRVYVQHRGNGALVRQLRMNGLEAFSDRELALTKPAQMSLF